METIKGDSPRSTASIHADVGDQGIITLTIKGRLDSTSSSKVWSRAIEILKQNAPNSIIVDASKIDYCDASGLALLLDIRRRQEKTGGEFYIRGLAREFQQLLDLFPPGEFLKTEVDKPESVNLPKEVGKATANVWEEVRSIITFIGESGVALVYAALHPHLIRWKDVLFTAEKIGANALPIVALITFLMGLIMAFQAAIPMQQFGAQLFVADLIVISMFKELGPLMTAIVVNGRSSSAFAAELGTMKVNEEIDALNTMGLDPVRFLVTPKIIAAVIMIPVLTVFANLFGLIGGGVVMLSLDFPIVTYVNQITSAANYIMILGGLFKSVFFALIIAGIGCLEGLKTGTGSAAVGESTTRAVVSGIVFIIVVDGIFGVMYYYLGI